METYYSVDGENFEKLGHVSDIEITSDTGLTPEEEEIAERLYVSESFECSIPESEGDKLLRSILGQSAYNSMKLKQDGYLSPENGWFTPTKTETEKLMKKIEREIYDKERERCTKQSDQE